jgi:hypothetical protein
MTHNSSCELSTEEKCVCECKGAFHGIAKQMKLEEFNDKIEIIAQ